MEAGELAAVLVAAASIVATVVVVVAAWSLLRTMRRLRQLVEQLHADALPMVGDLRTTVERAGADLERVEDLLDTTERITATVDTASRLTLRALSPPLIKTLSLMAGARRAGRRLRGRGNGLPIEVRAHHHPPRGGRRHRLGRGDST